MVVGTDLFPCGGAAGGGASTGGVAGGGGCQLIIPQEYDPAVFTAFQRPLTFDRNGDDIPIPPHHRAIRFSIEMSSSLSDYKYLIHLAQEIENGKPPRHFNRLSNETRFFLVSKAQGLRSFRETVRDFEANPTAELAPHIVAARAMLEKRLNFSPIDVNIQRAQLIPSESAELQKILTDLRFLKDAMDETPHGVYRGVDFDAITRHFSQLPEPLRNYLMGIVYQSSQANGHDAGLEFGQTIIDGGFTLLLLKNRDNKSIIDQLIEQFTSDDPTSTAPSNAAAVLDAAMTTLQTLSTSERRIGYPQRDPKKVLEEMRTREKQATILRELRNATKHNEVYVHEERARELVQELEKYDCVPGDTNILPFLRQAFTPSRDGGGDLGDITLLNRIISIDTIDPRSRKIVVRNSLDMLIEYAETSAMLAAMEYSLLHSVTQTQLEATIGETSDEGMKAALERMREISGSDEAKNRMHDWVCEKRVALGKMICRAKKMIHEQYIKEREIRRAEIGATIEDVSTAMGIGSLTPPEHKWRILAISIESGAYSVGGLGPAVHGAVKSLPKDRYDAVVLTPYHDKTNPALKAKVERALAGHLEEGVSVSECTHRFNGVVKTDHLVRINNFKGASYLMHVPQDRDTYHLHPGTTFYNSGEHRQENIHRMAYFSNAVAQVALTRFRDGKMYDNVIFNDSHAVGGMRTIEADRFQDFRMGRSPAFTMIVHNNGFHMRLPPHFTRDEGSDWRNLHAYGVEHADTVATVSPEHVKELMGIHGRDLTQLYQERAIDRAFFGILNGIDTDDQDPARDQNLRKCRIKDLDAMTYDEMPTCYHAGYAKGRELLSNLSDASRESICSLLDNLREIRNRNHDQFIFPENDEMDQFIDSLCDGLARIVTEEGDSFEISSFEEGLKTVEKQIDSFIQLNSMAFTKDDPHIVEKKRIAKKRLQDMYDTYYRGKEGMPGANTEISFFDGEGKERPVLFYVGRYDAGQKGVHRFKEALFAAKETGATLIVMGAAEENSYGGRSATSYLDELEYLAYEQKGPSWGGAWVIREDKKPSGESGKYPYQMGHGDRPGIGSLVRTAADYLYSPSNYEPCGLTPPEAAMRGTAFALTNTGGFIDWVRLAGEGSRVLDGGESHRGQLKALLEHWKGTYRDDIVKRTDLCLHLMKVGSEADWKKSASKKYETLLAIARRRKYQRDLRFTPSVGIDTIIGILRNK